MRELKQPKINELWFGVCGKKLKFSIEEFALVSGLKCACDSNNLSFSFEKNRLVEKYFGGLKKINNNLFRSVSFQSIGKMMRTVLKLQCCFLLNYFCFYLLLINW